MPLHHGPLSKNPDAYATPSSSRALPKYAMPEEGTNSDVAYNLIMDELMLDGNARQNLATFCQTWLEPNIHAIMDKCSTKT